MTSPIEVTAFSLWANAQAARRALARGDAINFHRHAETVAQIGHHAARPSVRRTASSTLASLMLPDPAPQPDPPDAA